MINTNNSGNAATIKTAICVGNKMGVIARRYKADLGTVFNLAESGTIVAKRSGKKLHKIALNEGFEFGNGKKVAYFSRILKEDGALPGLDTVKDLRPKAVEVQEDGNVVVDFDVLRGQAPETEAETPAE